MDERSSLLIIVPTGIGALIEMWKCKKILKLDISWRGIKLRETANGSGMTAEQQTDMYDQQGMKYLSYVLYPLVLSYAVYSLVSNFIFIYLFSVSQLFDHRRFITHTKAGIVGRCILQ